MPGQIVGCYGQLKYLLALGVPLYQNMSCSIISWTVEDNLPTELVSHVRLIGCLASVSTTQLDIRAKRQAFPSDERDPPHF
jgi:hypothetical protein